MTAVQQEKIIQDITDLSLIIYRANRSLTQNADPIVSCVIPPAQMHALVFLKKSGSINMTELANLLMMTRQQLTRIIDSLVEKGLVARKNSPTNRRHVLIELTDEGENFLIDMMLSGPSLLSRLMDAMDEDDMGQLHYAITIIKELLSKI